MTTKTVYELESRWEHQGRMLAWGFITTRYSLSAAFTAKKDMESIRPKTPGFEIRIVRVTTFETREVIDLVKSSMMSPARAPTGIPRDSTWQPGERLDA